MTDPATPSWRQKIVQALVLLLLIALGARVAANLLAPLVPGLIIMMLLIAIFWLVIGRRK
jgi:hypothetical protein